MIFLIKYFVRCYIFKFDFYIMEIILDIDGIFVYILIKYLVIYFQYVFNDFNFEKEVSNVMGVYDYSVFYEFFRSIYKLF